MIATYPAIAEALWRDSMSLAQLQTLVGQGVRFQRGVVRSDCSESFAKLADFDSDYLQSDVKRQERIVPAATIG